jgi:chemotaxis signal transduction protein
VVLTRGGVTAGLLTEGVEGTADVESDSVEPSLANLPTATGALISGQITDSRGPVGVFDLEAVFGLADTLARSRRAV